MGRKLMRAGLFSILLCLSGAYANAAELATDLSANEIAITSSFTGQDLLLFGTKGGDKAPDDLDIIVVVHGPEGPMRIWRKTQVAGIWVNSAPVSFENVPGYYALASNRPLTEITNPETLRQLNIGPANLVLLSTEDVSLDELAELRTALIEDRHAEGLYIQDETAVTFPEGSLFRTTIRFPANVPVGDYRVLVRLFQDGREIDQTTTVVTVGKRGLEQWVYNFAHDWPLAYGLMAVLLAVFAGWLASVVFRSR